MSLNTNSTLRICILSFNHPHITEACVRSVVELGLEPHLTLTHNGSRPENVAYLKNLFPAIDHLVISQNSGFSGGANQTLRHAFQTHEWAFFLTNDCLLKNTPKPPSSPGLYAPMVHRRKMGFIDSIGGRFDPFQNRLVHFRNEKESQSILNRKYPQFLKAGIHAFMGYFYVPGTAFYFDRCTFNKLGGFDESLHTYWEDVDLSVRVQKAGLHVGIAPSTEVLHKVGKTCHKDPFYTQHLFHRNKKIVSTRYNPFLPNFRIEKETECLK